MSYRIVVYGETGATLFDRVYFSILEVEVMEDVRTISERLKDDRYGEHIDADATAEIFPMHPDTIKSLSEAGIDMPNWKPLIVPIQEYPPYEGDDAA